MTDRLEEERCCSSVRPPEQTDKIPDGRSLITGAFKAPSEQAIPGSGRIANDDSDRNSVTMLATLSQSAGHASTFEKASQQNRGLSPAHHDRLSGLGLSEQQFRHFIDCFVGHRYDFIRLSGKGHWYFDQRHYLTDGLLIAHLAGDTVLGTGCRYDKARMQLRTSFFVIDIDLNSKGLTDLFRRYDNVVAVLGFPSQLFRSSDSGGLHLYYHLENATSLHNLRSTGGRTGAVIQLLSAHGIVERDGILEVYPRGQSRQNGPQRRLRLPFGRGSRLLEPESLEPMVRGRTLGNLNLSAELFLNGKIRLYDPNALLASARVLPETASHGTAPSQDISRGATRTWRSAPLGHNEEHVRVLLQLGLTQSGELNRAASALAHVYRWRYRFSLPAAKQAIVEWLDRSHNGCSRTYSANPARAHRQVQGVVERVYDSRTRGSWIDLPGLSPFEIDVLFASTKELPSQHHFNHDVKSYKVERFGFEILRLAKQFAATEIHSELLRGIGDTTNESFTSTLARLRHVWPDPSRPEFVVPIPHTLRQGRARSGTGFLKGIGRDARWTLWKILQSIEFVRLVRHGSKAAGRAALYQVRLDFGALSSPSSINNYSVAVLSRLTSDQMTERYSAYQCRRIRREAMNSSSDGFGGSELGRVSRFIRVALADPNTAYPVEATNGYDRRTA